MWYEKFQLKKKQNQESRNPFGLPDVVPVPTEETANAYLTRMLRQHNVTGEITSDTRIPDHLLGEVSIVVAFRFKLKKRSLSVTVPCTVGDILAQLEEA
jgi:hypothetical protein